MTRFLPAFLILFVFFGFSCQRFSQQHWSKALPEYTPIIITADANSTPADLLSGEYMTWFDSMTPADRNKTEQFLSYVTLEDVYAEALVVFPHNSDDWMPVLVARTSRNLLPAAANHFTRPFTGNRYSFLGATIYQMYLDTENILYTVQLNDWVFITQSSFAIEEMVRTYTGDQASVSLTSNQLQSGRIIVNTPFLDRYVSLETAVRYRPSLRNAFKGSGIVSLSVTSTNESGVSNPAYSFEGTMGLKSIAERSNLVRGISTRNHSNVLDRYISQDVAVAALFSRLPDMIVPQNESENPIDRHMRANPSEFAAIAETLSPNFAFAAFASSGFLNVGEYAYLRLLDNRSAFVRSLDQLADDGVISKESSNTYLVRGQSLAYLLSGGLTTFEIHYITITDDAAIITQRPGVAQKLASDRSRRRSLYYEENYLAIRRSFTDQLGGFLYVQSEEFIKYAESLLNLVNSVDLIADRFDVLAMGFRLEDSGERLTWTTKSYNVERSTRLYEERWIASLDGTDLSGEPVFANIGGSPRDEVIAATQGGLVVALAADGTQVFRIRTDDDTPVGPPVAFDWYANNQMAILIGAGNKIYAWNNTGTPLPNFPIVLNETISAPIRIADITRNGLPEIVVATADRMVHVLDQRGNNINGWPQSVNSSVRTTPVIETIGNRRVIFAYAENVVFSWDNLGVMRTGYPVFNRAPLRGPLLWDRNHLLAGTADGAIVTIGAGDYFSNDYAISAGIDDGSAENIRIQTLELTNGNLILLPRVSTQTVNIRRGSDESESFETVNEPMLFASAENGSILGVNQSGALRFTQSLGQPAMSNTSPILADLNRNGRTQILGLAGFGRLYGWNLQRGDRYLSIPTASVMYPVVFDLISNGRMEIVAGTRDGLRVWTINPQTSSN